jgi:hypothetical protein
MNKRNTLIAVTALLCLAIATTAGAASNSGANKKAVKWMGSTSLTQFPSIGFRADAVSATVAAGAPTKTRNRFIDSVESGALDYAQTAGQNAKVILAAVAAKRNPQCFGPTGAKTDFYNQLMSNYKDGRFGSTSFDQALSMLALKAARRPIPKAAVKFVKNARGSHGWNFAMSNSKGDDVESTALQIEALRAAGVSKKDKALSSAYKWITLQRNSDSGYNPDTPQGETQANTTAYAIRAADALGKDNSKAKRALRALQQKNGSFRSSPGAAGDFAGIATSDAVIALSGKRYPVATLKKAGASCG